MCFKDKFTQPELDSEGFSAMIPAGHPLNGSDTYSDPRCYACNRYCTPADECRRTCEQRNPEGWQEVDGVKLPPINWAEPITPWRMPSPLAQVPQDELDGVHAAWLAANECPRSAECERAHPMECACVNAAYSDCSREPL